MIGYLSGQVKFLGEDSCILMVGGVGYRVFVDAQTRQGLEVGAAAEFFIYTAVREDAITLYGMKDQAAYGLFALLLTVSGIGAKTALAIVSKISAADFAQAIALQDLKTLMRWPGVGKKSAERILLELKGKVREQGTGSREQIVSTVRDEAAEALEALGYTAEEIATAFKNAPPDASTDMLIKFALKSLNRFA